MKFFARQTSEFRDRQEPRGDEAGFGRIEFLSADGTRLRGWTYQATANCSRGTVFLAHGFADNSASLLWDARDLSAGFGLVVVAFDHRMHGLSGDNIPSFGSLEALDLRAAMDYAEGAGLPAPYILHGVSLGALAAQRAGMVDTRVRGLFLEASPGWPRGAMVSVGSWRTVTAWLAGTIVNYCYGRDVLSDGDIRTIRQPDGHDPLVCSVIGARDRFGIENARTVFAHWRGAGAENRFPSDTREVRKWFWVIPDAVHPGEPGPELWQCEGFERLRREFYIRVLAEDLE